MAQDYTGVPLPDARGLTPDEIKAGVNSPQAAQSWKDFVQRNGLGNLNAPGYAAPGAVVDVQPPAAGIAPGNRGDAANAAVSQCARPLCIPGLVPSFSVTAAGVSSTPAAPTCVCWSDLIVYGAAAGAVLVGAWSMFLVRR